MPVHSSFQHKVALSVFISSFFAVVLSGCSEEGEERQGRNSATAQPAVATRVFDYKGDTSKVMFREATFEKDPCDKRSTLKLADFYNRYKNYEGALGVVRTFEEKCEKWHRLLWASSYAYRRLEKWDEGAAVTTQLIENDAVDSDYWWWRGRFYARAKKWGALESDLRQSLANKATGFPADLFWKNLGKTKPCQAAFALQFYVDKAKKVSDWGPQRLTEFWVQGDCDAWAGKGSALIKIKPGAPVTKLKLKVNGVKGNFILDRRAAYLTLSESFASKAKVSATEDGGSARVVGKILPLRLGVADEVRLKKAKAKRVTVATAINLPAGIDGVLGQSFLWRFKTKDSKRGLKLSKR